MKKLLLIFSVFVLNFTSVLGVTSCSARVIYEPDSDDDLNRDKNIEIFNEIKVNANKHFKEWWSKQEKININFYPNQTLAFEDLVNSLEIKNKEVWTGKNIEKNLFLKHLLNDFFVAFDNFNKELQNQYSNYYIDDKMPLLMQKNDIQFTLHRINFNKIVKMLEGTAQKIKGFTLEFNITYQINFKSINQPDQVGGVVVVSNNPNALSNMQDSLLNFFLDFIDDFFKKQDYQIIAPNELSYNQINVHNTFFPIIIKALKEKEVLFYKSDSFMGHNFISTPTKTNVINKKNSVLEWAGEGYNPDKLTVSEFLKFYQKKFFRSEGSFYVKGNIQKFVWNDAMIENLPFRKNSNKYSVDLKTPIKVLTPKKQVDEDLTVFANIVIDFWKYYKLETYKDNHKVVLNMKQEDFNILVKKSTSLTAFFTIIFNIFHKTLDFSIKNKFKIWAHHVAYSHNKTYFSTKLIKKEKSMIMELWQKHYKSYYLLYLFNFEYKNFGYSFIFMPDDKDSNINHNGFTFLHIVEVKQI